MKETPQQNILELSVPNWQAWLVGRGEKAFRAAQILKWIYTERVLEPQLMTNLSLGLRETLREVFELAPLELTEVRGSKEDPGTEKLLFRTNDKHHIEAVLLPNSKGKQTLCLSSQVGCPMGCAFCATGAMGFIRNLSLPEILFQVFWALKNRDISNLVFMGMGEPLLHPRLEEVLSRLIDPEYFNLSARGITVSTVGIAEGIKRLIPFKQVKLAWSLHSTQEERRKKLFPVLAGKYSYKQIVEELIRFQDATKKRITIEYLVMRGVNDDEVEWKGLLELSRKLYFHVNLIAYNPHPFSPYQAPAPNALYAIQEKLSAQGLEVTVRKSLGRDIEGACGQLAGKRGDLKISGL